MNMNNEGKCGEDDYVSQCGDAQQLYMGPDYEYSDSDDDDPPPNQYQYQQQQQKNNVFNNNKYNISNTLNTPNNNNNAQPGQAEYVWDDNDDINNDKKVEEPVIVNNNKNINIKAQYKADNKNNNNNNDNNAAQMYSNQAYNNGNKNHNQNQSQNHVKNKQKSYMYNNNININNNQNQNQNHSNLIQNNQKSFNNNNNNIHNNFNHNNNNNNSNNSPKHNYNYNNQNQNYSNHNHNHIVHMDNNNNGNKKNNNNNGIQNNNSNQNNNNNNNKYHNNAVSVNWKQHNLSQFMKNQKPNHQRSKSNNNNHYNNYNKHQSHANNYSNHNNYYKRNSNYNNYNNSYNKNDQNNNQNGLCNKFNQLNIQNNIQNNNQKNQLYSNNNNNNNNNGSNTKQPSSPHCWRMNKIKQTNKSQNYNQNLDRFNQIIHNQDDMKERENKLRRSMRHRHINGFNIPNYHIQPNVLMVVRMPEEHITWQSLNDVDCLDLIKKLLNKKQKNNNNNNLAHSHSCDITQSISYNTLYGELLFLFPDEYRGVVTVLNEILFTEESEGYISISGKIGKKECLIRIINDRPLEPKEIGKVFRIKNGKFKAITYDSRTLDEECESIREAQELLMKQPRFDPNLNWRTYFNKAFSNFLYSNQIFTSLEAELDCSQKSILSDLYLLPRIVINEINKSNRFYHQDVVDGECTFEDYVELFNNRHLSDLARLIQNEGVSVIHEKIERALQRKRDIQDNDYDYGIYRGIYLCKSPIPKIMDRNKNQIIIRNISEINNINCGSLCEYQISPNNYAINIRYISDKMSGFNEYTDIIGMNQLNQKGNILNNKNRRVFFNKQTIIGIICDELDLSGGTFDMHRLPSIIESSLNIKWDPKKFGFETLRKIFEDPSVKSICRLDNASSTALVSSIEKSKKIPTLDCVKKGFIRVLREYDPYNEGYRMKRKGSKKTDIRAHFAKINKFALKPKPWFGWSIKELLKKCADDGVFYIDYDSEPDGVWKLFLNRNNNNNNY